VTEAGTEVTEMGTETEYPLTVPHFEAMVHHRRQHLPSGQRGDDKVYRAIVLLYGMKFFILIIINSRWNLF
jgi:hypothetical protein